MNGELELVNEMVATIGGLPAESLTEESLDADSLRAKAVLKAQSRKIQNTGWWCNTETWTLQPVDGMILLPNNTLKVVDTTYMKRGNYLYDISEKSKLFDEEVEVDLVLNLAYEDMPESMYQYIGAVANLVFFMQEDGDQIFAAVLNTLKNDAYGPLQDDQLRFTEPNIITGNPTVSAILNSLTKRRV